MKRLRGKNARRGSRFHFCKQIVLFKTAQGFTVFSRHILSKKKIFEDCKCFVTRQREYHMNFSLSVFNNMNGALPHIWGFWHWISISSQQEVAVEAMTQ